MLIEGTRERTAIDRKKHNFAARQPAQFSRRDEKEEEARLSPQSIDVLLTITHMG